LIGGQACIIYGAAEFSRDSDFVIFSNDKNLEYLQKALKALKAKLIYVPKLEISYLERGHACHFRCNREDVKGLRIDVISKLRGCESFEKLWERRKAISLKAGETINIIGLEDLVQSKKTQRDKDWLMLKRLVEDDIVLHKDDSSSEHVKWWFFESRNADSLVRLAKKYPKFAQECIIKRPLLSWSINPDIEKLNFHLQEEENKERQKDIEYWAPLKKELETLRHSTAYSLPKTTNL